MTDTVDAQPTPVGRNPRHFDISFDQLDDGIERLCHCDHVVVDNPYHED